MSDIALCFDGESFDVAIENGDFVKDDGLETAVNISLFTNQRVSDAELPVLEADKMGWWADNIAETEGDQIGSKLWLLERTKITDDLIAALESYAQLAFSWMIEDGVARNVIATADIDDEKNVTLEVEIPRPNNEIIQLSFLWDGQELKRKVN